MFYCVFGEFPEEPACSAKLYNTTGFPEGVQAVKRLRSVDPEPFQTWESSYLGQQLREHGLLDAVASAPEMLQVQGVVPDPATLEYLRDAVGVLTCFLDHGGVALLDPQAFTWWRPEAWKTEVFAPQRPQPRRHVVILHSPDSGDGQTWFHTRGMRKFGRPDLSARRVPSTLGPAVIDLFNRFIEMQAFGGVVPEGQPVRVASLPDGLTCHHSGDLDDPDFNNVHIEIVWPPEP
jgi:hypothetical protein